MPPFLTLAFYLVVNIAAFATYAADKTAAQQHRWRVREATLLGLSAIGGAIGGLLAMYFLHHKTRKLVFWIVNLLGLAGHLLLVGLFLLR